MTKKQLEELVTTMGEAIIDLQKRVAELEREVEEDKAE